MGNKPSTTFRRVQPSLSHSSKYNRLSSSSKFDSQKPLLSNNYDENMEILKHEIEENRKKNESLERRNVTLEKDMQELRADMKSKKDTEKGYVAALEKQVVELQSTVAKLQSKSKSGQTGTESDSTVLAKKVENLELRLKKVEVDHLMTQRNQDTAVVGQKNTELSKQLVELTLIDEMPAIAPVADLLGTSMDKEFGNQAHHSADDLVGCLIVLIFLVTVLIGLNL